MTVIRALLVALVHLDDLFTRPTRRLPQYPR
jgi:hypothetical protein